MFQVLCLCTISILDWLVNEKVKNLVQVCDRNHVLVKVTTSKSNKLGNVDDEALGCLECMACVGSLYAGEGAGRLCPQLL